MYIELDKPVFTTPEVAYLLKITTSRVYQLLLKGQNNEGRDTGTYLVPASREYLRSIGIDQSIVSTPKHWITPEEVERYLEEVVSKHAGVGRRRASVKTGYRVRT